MCIIPLVVRCFARQGVVVSHSTYSAPLFCLSFFFSFFFRCKCIRAKHGELTCIRPVGQSPRPPYLSRQGQVQRCGTALGRPQKLRFCRNHSRTQVGVRQSNGFCRQRNIRSMNEFIVAEPNNHLENSLDYQWLSLCVDNGTTSWVTCRQTSNPSSLEHLEPALGAPCQPVF